MTLELLRVTSAAGVNTLPVRFCAINFVKCFDGNPDVKPVFDFLRKSTSR